jgi:FSR family fosmidomycin resistance protein-like MFS transporter
MTTNIAPAHPLTTSNVDSFQTHQVLPIAAAHFVHDIYTAFVPTLLPVLIQKFTLTLTQAGSLNIVLQLPALLNPFIGYLADRVSLRYFVILAPAVTATLIALMGFAPGYFALLLLMFAAGVSVAAFHAPAPAMIGRVAGRQVGLGMSIFMTAGELSRTVGPLVAVWAVSAWTLDGLYRTAVLGWAASLVLFLRLRGVPARPGKPASLRNVIPLLTSLFLPLALINLARGFLLESLSTFLPTFMHTRGASLAAAGAALSVLSFAGAAGALLSGPLSDRLGRRSVIGITTLLSSVLMLVFLRVEGWLVVPALLALGFTTLATTPVMMALVQEQMPEHRAVGNGLYMVIAFLLRPVATLVVGAIGDRFGLEQAFFWSALASLLALPVILLLPKGH